VSPEADAARRAFLEHLTRERNLSPHTRLAYSRDLARLAAWCDAQGLSDWTRLDHGHVRLFAAQSHAGGLGPKSVQRLLSAVRSFYTFLQREGLAGHNPAAEVRAPKAPRRLPRTIDADLMQRVLDSGDGEAGTAGEESDPVLALRDQAIMELLYSSGLRLSELVGLNLTSIDLADRLVTVRGKGDKMRIVPVGSKAVAAIRRWLAERHALAPPEEPALFVGRNGRRLGARTVQLRLAAHARRQGLPVHLHPHLFRHSFASHLLESSHDLRGVQELLGHANLATTQIYTHLDFQHLAHIYDQAHPRARRGRRGGG
jgi:integrase/recombinase XerC